MNKILASIYLWLDADAIKPGLTKARSINWLRCLPFILTHIVCLAVFWVGYGYQALIVCFLSYFVRMFAITGFYHREGFKYRGKSCRRSMGCQYIGVDDFIASRT